MKDFKIRYRNMSLGVLWSILNPLVMMGVLTIVFGRIFPNPSIELFPVFILCGLVPWNFFTQAWNSATTSLTDNVNLVKRVAAPRLALPIASVIASGLQIAFQIALLLTLVIIFGKGVNLYWVWLPLLWVLELVFACGMGLVSSSINVYIRDTRYIVESVLVVFFWFVPIFYPASIIPQRYQGIYMLNPVTEVVMGTRNILLEAKAPPTSSLINLVVVSLVMLALGFGIFVRMQRRFYELL